MLLPAVLLLQWVRPQLGVAVVLVLLAPCCCLCWRTRNVLLLLSCWPLCQWSSGRDGGLQAGSTVGGGALTPGRTIVFSRLTQFLNSSQCGT